MAEQSVTLNPGESKLVSFEATPHEAKAYQVSVDGLSGSFVAIAPAAVEVTGITINPTNLTTAVHEYETSLGLGFWGDPFTISITFKNPYAYDVWVRPDYAFGHLTGDPLKIVGGGLQGFDAEKLLYFRLLLSSAAIEGDYSYTSDWQKPYDARGQNTGSNMVLGIYDPDGVPRTIGAADYWLKIPPKGSITMVKEGHLSSDLQVTAYECALCGMLIDSSGVQAHYDTYHPGIEIVVWSWGGLSGAYIKDSGENAVNQVYVPAEGVAGPHDLCVVAGKVLYLYYEPHYRTVGGKQYLINWKSAALDPCAAVVPNMINITPA